jgi:3-dehydroquinate dehydratase / shikimate dehydrogenase
MDVLEPVKTMVGPALHIVHRWYKPSITCTIGQDARQFASADTFDNLSHVLFPGLSRMIAKDRICAIVAAADARSLWAQVRRALDVTRTIELRLDWLSDDAEIAKFLARLRASEGTGRTRATFIATCRRREAGGKFTGTIAQQLVHLAEAIRAGCAWYDLEIETSSLCPPELLEVLLGEGQKIASAHFFQRTRKHLKRVAADLACTHAAAIKIAVQCDSLTDSINALGLVTGRKNAIAIPMGEVAQPARVLALREGSALAYAPVENATAPGQVPLDALKHLYRADTLRRKTRIYGVIGDPVGQSLSPVLQNAGFQAHKMDAVFLPFLVRDLRDFLGAITPLGIAGFSVTIPHKQAILRHLDDCDPMAAAIGAVNTVVVRGGGKLYGYNTDYVGVLRALGRRIPLRGSRTLIFGAGGAARAVAFALAESGAAVCICARRMAQARALARAVGGEAVERRRLQRELFDAIVNATPVGMYPHRDRSPLQAVELNCRLVFDLIYRPRTTKLLQRAVRRGIETISGVEMFLAQGTAQWAIWTGERAPESAMRRAVLRALRNEEKMAAR